MKQFLFILTCFCGGLLFGQSTFETYLEESEPSSLKEMVGAMMNPKYAAEIKENRLLVEDFIFVAGSKWVNYSEADLKSWEEGMKYLIGLGVPMNDEKEYENNSLFYWTALNLDVSNPNSNQYLLHTSLLKLGGKTEVYYDGGSFLFQSLYSDAEVEPVRDAYIQDFKSWPIERKRDALFAMITLDFDDYGVALALRKLLEIKAFDVNIRTKNEKSTLFDQAVTMGGYETANMLLDNGYDVNQRCFACNGETPLHIIVEMDDNYDYEVIYGLVFRLMEKGADADLRNMDGLTPIHLAISKKNEAAFQVFISPDAKFNYQLLTIKGKGYLEYFDDKWGDQDFRLLLMEKTGLKPPPTKEEKKEMKETAKEKKKSEKDKKKSAKDKTKAAKKEDKDKPKEE